ncbi:LuxR C-terminal-related transcriptional regulator [Streptomyces sp. NPDC059155]|uniref:LuxR C-terminal-related transcriptional regulator n=1 Tax=unclassified Streptomyces TaxID=2593676 RepID=UPI0033D347FE
MGLILVSTSGGTRSAAGLSQPGGTGDARAVGEGSTGNAEVRRLAKLDVRILEGVAVGTSTVQLASSLHLSRQGVEYRIGLMLRQFQVANRAALVSRAHSLGVLSVGAWPPRVLPEFLEQ